MLLFVPVGGTDTKSKSIAEPKNECIRLNPAQYSVFNAVVFAVSGKETSANCSSASLSRNWKIILLFSVSPLRLLPGIK